MNCGKAEAAVLDEKYTLVTVFFSDEIPLLKLQARSLKLYAPESLIAEILIVDNSEPRMDEAVVADIARQYGHLQVKLRVIRADEICEISNASGWDSQQILKLAISQIVQTPKYVVLDAKTHLVNNLERSLIVSEEGLARANIINYSNNALSYALKRALNFFDLLATSEEALDSVTPFVFYTHIVRDLVGQVESRAKCRFPVVFLREGFTEFILYSVFLSVTNRSVRSIYDIHQKFPVMIWEADCDPSILADKLNQARNPATPFLSVHRRSFGHIGPEAATMLSRFWLRKGLFSSEAEAAILIAEMAYRPRVSRKSIIRSRWLRVIYLIRRIQARIRLAMKSSFNR